MVTDEEAEDIVHGVITGIITRRPEAFESLEHIRNYVAKSILNRAIQVKRRADKHVPWSEILEQEISAVQDGSEEYVSVDAEGLRDQSPVAEGFRNHQIPLFRGDDVRGDRRAASSAHFDAEEP
jgi:DNA-directed RNA polymerase specialized sigma24 family protein